MLGIVHAAATAWLQGAAVAAPGAADAARGVATRAASEAATPATSAAIHAAADSIRMDTSPLPGGVASVFRFLFSGVPQWIQVAGVVVGAIVAVVLVVVGWRRRAAIGAWLAAQSQGYKVALGAGVGTTLLAAGLVGGWSYNYMMHENDFCSSCHVMSSAFGRFQTSEHSKLECHACHQQSIFASAKELYYWVMERPEKIPAHSPVPNRICGECHITQRRDSVWQFISATAGHQLHMKSDSSALRDLMCVSCHGKEVHAFAPVDLSCKQSGCHDDVRVRLGRMADQTSLHCATCHEFTRPVAESAPLDSGRQGLVPLKAQCFTCHEMREKLAERGLDRDPHDARCGDCHNPHDQTTAVGAVKSCQSAGCHASADTLTAFHRGLGSHALDDCVACHVAHSWKVESTDCLSCHRTIFEDRPPKRALLRRTSAAGGPGPTRRAAGHASSTSGHAPSAALSHAGASAAGEAVAHAPPPPHGPRAAAPVLPVPAWRGGAAGAPHAAQDGRRRPGGPSAVDAQDDDPRATPVAAGAGTLPWRAMAPWRATGWSDEPPAATARQRPAPRRRPAAPAASSPAPFRHSRHRKLACETCHRTVTRHGELTVRDAASCQGCHHAGDARAGTCTTCHLANELATPIERPVAIRVSGRPDTVTRRLAFEHARHAKEACATCHAADLGGTVVKVCTSCHTEHHAIQRSCTACHPTPRAGHARDVHDGCASCHHDATVAAFPPAQELCLSCHAEQRTHYPSRNCVACHRVSWNDVKPGEGTR